jgi:hypothetical protein
MFKDKLISLLAYTFNNPVEIIDDKEVDLSVQDVICKVQQFEIPTEGRKSIRRYISGLGR